MAARILVALAAGTLLAAAPVSGRKEARMFDLSARRREQRPDGSWTVREQRLRWRASETAVIVCDMWDRHWCRGASERAAELAPRADRFVAEARDRGALVIHAPSSCMEAYRDHPARRRAREAPRAAILPDGIEEWCHRIPAEEQGEYPIDQSDGGCDDQPPCEQGSPWRSQIAAIRIRDEDAVSDSGAEIWSLMEARGIRNVMLLGVHANMCVLGRPFGLRNMARFGKNVVLVRDLTDTMYNSRARPFVSHFRGTELIVEHIEKYVCPSITSDQVAGGAPFRFRMEPAAEPARPQRER